MFLSAVLRRWVPGQRGTVINSVQWQGLAFRQIEHVAQSGVSWQFESHMGIYLGWL
jgi:hypothetical protein